MEDGKILGHVHLSVSSAARRESGMGVGLMVAEVDAGDFDLAGSQQFIATARPLPGDDTHPGEALDFQADGDFVVETGRFAVVAGGLASNETDAVFVQQLRLAVAGASASIRCGSARKNAGSWRNTRCRRRRCLRNRRARGS